MALTVWLDAQNRVISAHESFRGTLTQTSVYPRAIVKKGLTFNVTAVTFAHSHPSVIAYTFAIDNLLSARRPRIN